MLETFLTEIIEDRIIVGNVTRIVWVSNACKIWTESVDHMILVGHVARIVSMSNACNIWQKS
jgi:hypothetical protein